MKQRFKINGYFQMEMNEREFKKYEELIGDIEDRVMMFINSYLKERNINLGDYTVNIYEE